jgi:energy-coupling factor transporter transmembrane protein EcfT
MRLADIDLAATSGTSVLHRAAPGAKLAAVTLVLAAVVVSQDVRVVTAMAGSLVVFAVAFRLPVRRILSVAAYPLFFALVFAFSAAADLPGAALIVGKAFTAALSAVILVFTTPYPQVFAPIQRFIPSLVGDALLFTYRSFFLLTEKVTRLTRVIRLRAGLDAAHPVAAGRIAVKALGGLLLYTMDLAQRDHDIMRLRGYDRRLRVAVRASESRSLDAAVVGGGLLLLVMAVVGR